MWQPIPCKYVGVGYNADDMIQIRVLVRISGTKNVWIRLCRKDYETILKSLVLQVSDISNI